MGTAFKPATSRNYITAPAMFFFWMSICNSKIIISLFKQGMFIMRKMLFVVRMYKNIAYIRISIVIFEFDGDHIRLSKSTMIIKTPLVATAI